MKWLMFWAADKYMRVEMISSAIQVYFVLAHSWTLQSPALFVFTWTLYPMCQEPIADVQKDWQNENEVMKKKWDWSTPRRWLWSA